MVCLSLILFFVSSRTTDKASDKVAVTAFEQEKIRQIAKGIFEECRMEDGECYEEKVASRLLDKYQTENILKAVYDYDVYFSCHAFTHFLGRALYRNLKNVADAYSQINFTCHGGSYHGVLEAFLDERKTPIDDLSGKDLEQICSDSPKKSKKNKDQIFTECLHGFGHAFMFITDADLPAALAYCDKLDAVHRERCFGGVFMENSTSSTNSDHPTKWLREGDNFFPCTILGEQYLNQCYFYQANYLLKITNRDYKQVFADCSVVVNSVNHDYCVLGLGAQLASVSNERGVDVAAAVCQIGQDNDAFTCIEGAVPSLFARYGGNAPQIFDFCRKVTPFLSEFCFAKLGSVARTYWQYSDNRLQSICQNAGQFLNACMGSSDINFRY